MIHQSRISAAYHRIGVLQSSLTRQRTAVAAALNVPRTRIERIAREEKPVTADTALRLGKFFKTGAALQSASRRWSFSHLAEYRQRRFPALLGGRPGQDQRKGVAAENGPAQAAVFDFKDGRRAGSFARRKGLGQ